jgi:peptidoglycan/LPS O-acetylase OafA/YrhL
MKLTSLQAYRAIAAILVVLFHVTDYAHDRLSAPFLGGLFAFGFSGVDFFFVLSGFIILYVHHGDIGRPTAVRSYVTKRFLRIFPVYWMVTATKIVAIALVPGYAKDYERELGTVVKSFLLIPQEHLPLVGAAWTLSHELLFYALFATFILLGLRVAAIIFGGWGVAIVALSLSPTEFTTAFGLDHYLIRFALNERNLEFIAGCVCAWICLRRSIGWSALWLVGGSATFLAAGLYVDRLGALPPLVHTLLFGAGSFMIVTGSFQLERAGRLRVPRVLVYLGDASYSMYLLAFAFVNIVGMAATRISHPEVAGLLAPVMAVTAICGGAASYLVLERPILRITRARRSKRTVELGQTVPA